MREKNNVLKDYILLIKSCFIFVNSSSDKIPCSFNLASTLLIETNFADAKIEKMNIRDADYTTQNIEDLKSRGAQI